MASVTENDRVDSILAADYNDESSVSSSDEVADTGNVPSKKRKRDPKGKWDDDLLVDMVDIVVNNTEYKQKLLFQNSKKSANSKVYQKIVEEMKIRSMQREQDFTMSIDQVRRKMKNLVLQTREVAITIKSKSGIKRCQDTKGAWFGPLFSLIKTRESCLPGASLEPTTITGGEDLDDDMVETEKPSDFVPVKKAKSRRQALDSNIQMSATFMKQLVENDPTDKLIAFMKEENDKNRASQMQILQLLFSQKESSKDHHHHVAPFVPNIQHESAMSYHVASNLPFPPSTLSPLMRQPSTIPHETYSMPKMLSPPSPVVSSQTFVPQSFSSPQSLSSSQGLTYSQNVIPTFGNFQSPPNLSRQCFSPINVSSFQSSVSPLTVQRPTLDNRMQPDVPIFENL